MNVTLNSNTKQSQVYMNWIHVPTLNRPGKVFRVIEPAFIWPIRNFDVITRGAAKDAALAPATVPNGKT